MKVKKMFHKYMYYKIYIMQTSDLNTWMGGVCGDDSKNCNSRTSLYLWNENTSSLKISGHYAWSQLHREVYKMVSWLERGEREGEGEREREVPLYTYTVDIKFVNTKALRIHVRTHGTHLQCTLTMQFHQQLVTDRYCPLSLLQLAYRGCLEYK